MSEPAGLGAMLRECRETKGLSLDDLSRDTRISLRALLALEEDRLKDLPAPIFVRGFIRAYCRVVGESPERALAFYDSASGAPHGPSAVPRSAALVQAPARPSRLGLRSLAAKVGVAGALVVVVGGVAYLFVTSASSRPSATPVPRQAMPAAPAVSPAAPSVVSAASAIEPPVATPASAAAVPAVPAAPAPIPAAPAPIAARAPAPAPKAPAATPAPAPAARPAVEPRTHVLVARAHEATWVSVRGADGVASQETLEAGSVREWQSAGRFTVTVGNAGGLTLELDGVALPPLGGQGQVVRDVRLPREPMP
jgi:cytoskeleton protein RodZ